MKKNLFLIAVTTVVIAACSSDLDEASVVESCPVRLCTDGLTGMTRAGQSVQLTQFLADQQVGIFLAEDNGNSVSPAPVTSGTNVTTYGQPLTYVANGSGGLANTQYWPQDGNGLHIYGVYPLAAATAAATKAAATDVEAYNATGVSFTIQADQSTNSDPTIGDANYMASDLMTGLPTYGNPVARTTAAVPLTFTHLLTKIDVSLTAGSGFTQADMANAVVSILGTKPTTTFSVQSANVGTASGDATTITAGTGASTSAIIVPQALAANASFIQVAVGGGNYIYKLPAAITFAPSTKYTYNLTVTKTGLTLSGTTITPWNSVAPITGNAEMPLPGTDLSTITSDYTASDGEILRGTLGSNVKISIADGATVTLKGVTINGGDDWHYQWAGINCLGDATIILAAGTTNTVKGFDSNPGIYVPEGSTLTIKGKGTLDASGNEFGGAGIGGGRNDNSGNIDIQDGNITATGGSQSAGIGSGFQKYCGYITISGGTVTATGGNQGAGIGSGYMSSCGAITISGGVVTATGGEWGSGIGSGYMSSCGAITISGVTVTATGGKKGAGIGSGEQASCGNINISGGTVTAIGGEKGAGIGNGYLSSCGTITISGGTIDATGGEEAAGIGSGYYTSCSDITILNTVTKVTATKGESSPFSIGLGNNALENGMTCGTITIGNTTYWQDNAPVNGGDTYLATSPRIYEPE